MVATTIEAFRKQLRETGEYHTASECLAPRRRRPSAWRTFRFSLSVVRVFPLCALYEALHRLDTDRWARFCFSAVTMPERCGMRVDIEGFGARRAHAGPVVYLCNHFSTYETIALVPILHALGPFGLVTKRSLAHLPALERAAAHMNLVGIERKDPKADLLQIYDQGGAMIAAGKSFLVFPQGTRQSVFSRQRFSSLGAKLAEKAGVPVVPIVVDSRCMPTRTRGLLKRVFKDFGPVDTSRDIRIAAGPVIPPGRSREVNAAAFDWMADKLEQWGMAVER